MCPVGSKCSRGYSGNTNPGKSEILGCPGISALQVCPSQISLVLLLPPSLSFSPLVVIMRPSPNSVMVGYQRPCAVEGALAKDSLEGSKIEVFGKTVKGMSPACPTLPSCP